MRSVDPPDPAQLTGIRARRNGLIRHRVPDLSRQQWAVLALVSIASLFNQYDRALFALALPQIQASLAIDEAHVGYLGSIVRLGALPAFAVAVVSDRIGRRRALLGTIVAYTLLTGATALVPSATSFVACQFLSTAFSQAQVILAVVVLAEELDAEHRGWGIGVFYAIQATGAGLAAALLPLVDTTREGWRILYAVGLVPLSLLALWWRRLPETRRFDAYRHGESRSQLWAGGFLAPVVALASSYPRRFLSLMAVVFFFSVGVAAADFMGPKYLQQAHGWAPAQVTLLYLTGGALGILGSVVAGRASDRGGRRRVTVAFGLAAVVFILFFYNAAGPLIPIAWVAGIFASLGHDTLLGTFGAELFPTSHRATAGGARVVAMTIGGALGLAAESLLYEVLGSHWSAISLLLLIVAIGPLIVAVAFPETAGISLEEIAPERARKESR